MKRRIVGFHLDDERHWVAELDCGHNQHVRHDPPWTRREWVTTAEGRAEAIGRVLECVKCDEGALPDARPMSAKRRLGLALATSSLLFVPTFGIPAFVALVLGAWQGALLTLVVGWGFWAAVCYPFVPAIDTWMKKRFRT